MTAITWNATELARDDFTGQVTTRFHGKWVNRAYWSGRSLSWSPIDINFAESGNGWIADKSSWVVVCPQRATGVIVAANHQCYDVHSAATVIGDASVMEIEHAAIAGPKPAES